MISYSKLGKMGRLGNQLFQIASTIGIAKKNGENYGFPYWDYGKYFVNKIPVFDVFPNYVHTERGFHYSEIIGKNIDLLGYFQSEKYFNVFESDIRNYFRFNDDLLGTEDLKEYCSLHIRRTDYLKFPDYHPFPGMDYYNRSVEYMKSLGFTKFLIFSDDISWCKENFNSSFSYSENNEDIKDLALMTKCGAHIIANSSFSWWGAWLNNDPNKIVVAPKNWFGHAKNGTNTDDLYCNNWVKF